MPSSNENTSSWTFEQMYSTGTRLNENSVIHLHLTALEEANLKHLLPTLTVNQVFRVRKTKVNNILTVHTLEVSQPGKVKGVFSSTF